MTVWNVLVPVLANVEAPTAEIALDKFLRYIAQRGLYAYTEDQGYDVSEAEPGTEKDL